MQRKALAALRAAGTSITAEEVAAAAGIDDVEAVFKALRRASANPDHGVSCDDAGSPASARFHANSL